MGEHYLIKWLCIPNGCTEIWAPLQMFKSYFYLKQNKKTWAACSNLFPIFLWNILFLSFLYIELSHNQWCKLQTCIPVTAFLFAYGISALKSLVVCFRSQRLPAAPEFQEAMRIRVSNPHSPCIPSLCHMNLQSSPTKVVYVFLLVQGEQRTKSRADQTATPLEPGSWPMRLGSLPSPKLQAGPTFLWKLLVF